MKIYLDENISSHRLKDLLTRKGFRVKLPSEAGLMGRSDPEQLDYARKNHFLLLTRNPSDFLALHESNPRHSGIIAIYQDNNVKKDMSYDDIASALHHLLKQRVPIKANFIVLNNYRQKKKR